MRHAVRSQPMSLEDAEREAERIRNMIARGTGAFYHPKVGGVLPAYALLWAKVVQDEEEGD